MEARPVFESGDARFPQYLRLFWTEIRTFLESKKDLSYFEEFRDVYGDDETFDYVREVLTDPELALLKYTDDPDMGVPKLLKRKNPLDADKKKEKEDARKAEIAELLQENSALLKEQETTGLLFELLHNDEAIKVLDELLKKHNPDLYKRVHLYLVDHKSKCLAIFLERFFKNEVQDESDDESKENEQPEELDDDTDIEKPMSDLAIEENEDFKENELPVDGKKPNSDQVDIPSHVFLDAIAASFDPVYAAKGLERVCKRAHLENINDNFSDHDEKDNHYWGRCFLRELPRLKFLDDEWFFNFIKALADDPYNRAVLQVMMKDYREELAAREEESRVKRQAAPQSKQIEKLVEEEITVCRPQKAYKKFLEECSDQYENRKELKLRSYQEELVQSARAGKNSVVCAPTGSGKTEVGVFIALRHLETKRFIEKTTGRVVMLVPKVVLVDQQRERFHDYLKGGGDMDTYTVNGYSGSQGPKESDRTGQFLGSDVIVMTPQIFHDMLNDPREDVRIYLCDVTLIIFDEVHHCTKKHVYQDIMDEIKDYKYAKPQIVGLTASLMTAGGSNLESGLESIYRLMANVTATSLSTVREHTRELEKYISRPDEWQKKMSRPLRDAFRDEVLALILDIKGSIMDQLKTLTKQNTHGVKLNPELINLSSPQCPELFISKLNALKAGVDQINRGDFKLAPAIALPYMLALARGLAVNDLMPSEFALKAITMQMNELVETYKNDISQQYFAKFQKALEAMKRSCTEEQDKPILAELKTILREHFEKDPQSRCIIFVEQRSTACNLHEYLNRCQLFGRKRDFGFVTSTKGSGSSLFRQSAEDQRTTIGAFGAGKIKAVVATSVLDEGIDVSACNLIIKYNVQSTGISRIQKLGRARAHMSKSWFLCIDDKAVEAEYDAIIAEHTLTKCVAKIHHDGEAYLTRKVTEWMAKQEKARADALEQDKQSRQRMAKVQYDVLCSLGNHKICDSRDIRLIQSHYVVMNCDIWTNLQVEVTDKSMGKFIDDQTTVVGKTRCIGSMELEELDGGKELDCGCQMGKIVKTCGIYLPTLAADKLGFSLTSGTDYQEEPVVTNKSWRAIQDMFHIPTASNDDLIEMANALVEKGRGDIKLKLDLQCEKIKRDAARELQRRKDNQARLAELAKNKQDW